MINRVAGLVAFWVVADTLREVRWERQHDPDEVSPWRIARLDALIKEQFEQGNSVVVFT